MIKGNKSAIFIAVKEGGDLALPKKAKSLTSSWLESYINGDIYQWRKKDFPSFLTIPPLGSGITILYLLDSINEIIRD